MSRAVLLVLLVAAAACRSRPPSPFARVTANDGRIYYARIDRSLFLEKGPGEPGFITFRDLVTGETVKLYNGSYVALEVPPSEVKIRQLEYLEDPTVLPRAPEGAPPTR